MRFTHDSDTLDGSAPLPEPGALRCLSFQIPSGARTAVVGASGAGKTTMLNLLARLYDPTQGRIFVLGRDISQTGLSISARIL